MNITKGIKKQITTALGIGEFLRIGKLDFPYNNNQEDGLFIEKSCNVDILLFRDEAAYNNKEMSFNYFGLFNLTVYVNYNYSEIYWPTKPLIELLYDKILENPFFENSERILIEIPDTMPVNLNLT